MLQIVTAGKYNSEMVKETFQEIYFPDLRKSQSYLKIHADLLCISKTLSRSLSLEMAIFYIAFSRVALSR